ncbi:LiaF transmembrane domain-containing protein [Clostridium polynesiense]|uniref:LiaF transmembrane domain-containing protein n=1 Tax=Clostridium polynesiense TaxID=1325933 RepID=UPI00058D3C77|nr:hypothetical protein [Clostridium polynesiense]
MRQWKVGSISLGVLLILIGILWIYSSATGISLLSSLFKWWPLILIMLGIEILIYSLMPKNENTKVKFDGVSITFIVLILLFMAGAQIVNKGIYYGLNFFENEIGSSFKYNTSFNKEYVFDAKGREKLKINDAVGRVFVESVKDNKITINAVVKFKTDNLDIAKEKSEKVIIIEDSKVLNIKHFMDFPKHEVQNVSVDYVIKVPENIALEIHNNYGETNVVNLSSNINILSYAGKVSVENIKGNVNIDNKFGATDCIQVIGNVKIENSNGKIYAENIEGKSELYGKFGSINTEDLKGEVIINNDNGTVEFISNEIFNNSLRITSNLGKVSVILPENQQGDFNCKTKLGIIRTDFPLSINKSESGSSIKEKLGEGPANFTILNNNGSIEISN